MDLITYRRGLARLAREQKEKRQVVIDQLAECGDRLMHTLRVAMRGDGVTVYRIGYYDPSSKVENWRMLGELDTLDDALAYVSYLNGGPKPSGPPIKPPS